MDPSQDRIARRLADIKKQEQELDREAAERDAATADPAAAVVRRRQGGYLRSLLSVIAILLVASGLFGLAVTLNRFAGEDMTDASREGQATVGRCVRHGPVSTRGFGFWDSCEAEIAWADGQRERVTVGEVFTSADVGTTVRVGDLGSYRGSKQLARADETPRPWLTWLGYAVGVVAMVPTLVGVLLLRELLRFRRR